ERRRVPLPTYPFERQRYWVETAKWSGRDGDGRRGRAAAARSADVSDWFYLPSWQATMPPAPVKSEELRADAHTWLVFADAKGWGAKLVERLEREGQRVSMVSAGNEYVAREGGAFQIDARRPEDYERLAAELNAEGLMPERIVHLWSVAEEEAEPGYEYFERCLERGFYSLIRVAQALARQKVRQEIRLVTVTSGLHDLGGEGAAAPERATILGPCKVIAQEHPHVACRSIDFALGEAGEEERESFAERLLAEVTSDARDAVVAYRGHRRFAPSFEQVPVASDAPEVRRLREGGVYLITGGLGRVGLLLARYLARECRAKLVLTARTPLPPRDEWDERAALDEEFGRKVGALRAIEEEGGEVFVASADVADEQQMRALVDEIDERFGRLDGVLHAAAAPASLSAAPVLALDSETAARVFRPKVGGLYVLEKVLRGRELDFCLAFSSNAAVLGGLGFAAYAAANLFVDAFAASRGGAASPPRWMSANWDGWAVEEDELAQADARRTANVMSPRESVEAFRRVVTRANTSRVIVSPTDLFERARNWLGVESGTDAARGQQSESAHERPNLQSEFAAPTSEIEQTVADVWQSLLGIKALGIHDNFFELGGHSLLATQVVSRLRETFDVDVPLRAFFERPTIAELASLVEELLLEEIEALPEEEAERLVNHERPARAAKG
ncbi:MAG TPA: SDR family oxidoreductase, partial [Pyrinomonadaceae bacterium]|nr:SDR family oxidoreductase [Pyrinomonadaceae bacterium]